MSHESIKLPATSDNSIPLLLTNIVFRLKIKFDGQCLKQDKVTFNHKTVLNIYLYEINVWPFKQSADFMSGYSLLGAIESTIKMLIFIDVNIPNMVLNLM